MLGRRTERTPEPPCAKAPHGAPALWTIASEVLRRTELIGAATSINIGGVCAKESDQHYVPYITSTPGTAMPVVQMESEKSQETVQGIQEQASVKASNTIITRDSGEEVSTIPRPPAFGSFASSEESTSFNHIVNRWLALEPIYVNTAQRTGSIIANYRLPEVLFSMMPDSVLLLPFSTFLYSELDFEVRFVVNANRFHCGRIIASYRSDCAGVEEFHSSVSSAVTRPHILLDLSTNVEGVLKIPFDYHRAFIRNIPHNNQIKSVVTAYSTLVTVSVLSPLRGGEGAPNDVNIRPFLRLTRANFYGMSYRVALAQMDTVRKVVDVVAPPAIRRILRGIEIIHDEIGSNFDKPSDYTVNSVVPVATPGFPWGKGPTVAFPLRLTPSGTTVSIGETRTDPQTTLDIARIWGLYLVSIWNANAPPGTLIIDFVVDPTMRYPPSLYQGHPTPLEYVTGMYNFWSGAIDLRLDFISNMFHTGAVMICAEFGRCTENCPTEWKSAMNTYTKTFHLGDQKSVEFTVPYIYDTVWRRSNAAPYFESPEMQPEDNGPKVGHVLHVISNPHVRVKVYVVNELRPPATASQDIEVHIYWRGSTSYRLHGLTQSGYVPKVVPFVLPYHPGRWSAKKGEQVEEAPVPPEAAQFMPKQPDGPAYVVHDELRRREAPTTSITETPPTPINVPVQNEPPRPLKEEDTVHIVDGRVTPPNIAATASQSSVVDKDNLVEGVLPIARQRIIKVRDGNGRSGCEDFTKSRVLLRSTSYKEQYDRIAYYVVYSVVDPLDYLRDKVIGYVRVADYTPHTQMERDGNDPTANFSAGLPALSVQTTEDQTSIKDILRRPLLILDRKTLTRNDLRTFEGACVVGLFVPIRVPDFNAMSAPSNQIELRVTKNTPGGMRATPQCALLAMFRFWRGSTRYTIICHDNSPEPIYITHLPRSGVYIRQVALVKPFSAFSPIYGSGLATQIMVPSVNSVMTVEVPFDSENLWCLTSSTTIPNESLGHRDRTDTTVGHLVLNSYTERLITIWWSAGDDFEVANFYGIPECTMTCHVKSIAEGDFPVTQMESLKILNKELKNLPTVTEQIRLTAASADTAIGDVQALTNEARETMIRMEDQIGTTMDNFNQLATAATSVTENVDAKVNSISSSVESLTEDARTKLGQLSDRTDSLLSFIETHVTGLVDKTASILSAGVNVATFIRDIIMDLIVAGFTRSWMALGVGICRALCNLLQISNKEATSYGLQLWRWLESKLGRSTLDESPEVQSAILGFPHTQMESVTGKATLAGIVLGLLGAGAGVHLRQTEKYESYFDGCLHALTSASTMSYLTGVVRLVEKIFHCMEDMVKDFLTYNDPEARALRELCKNSAEIDTFVKEVQRYTLEVNTRVLMESQYRQKIWCLVIQAHMFQRALIMAPVNKATNGLVQACRQIINFANEHHIDLTSSPLRFEPFCLGLYGEPGIGKSHLTAALSSGLLDAVGYNIGGADTIYTRMPGMQFWDGYRNQPVILYDDFGNMTRAEALGEQIKELYQLKTSAEFIANMASLNDKGMRGTPVIVVLNSNDDFPTNVTNVCSQATAVYRRRDQLVEVRLKKGYTTSTITQTDPQKLRNYPHLQFRFHRKPADKTAGYEEKWYGWEDFRAELHRRFVAYHRSKMAVLKMRMKDQISSVLKQYDANKIVDPYVAFWDLQGVMDSSPGGLPSDKIEAAVKATLESIQSLQESSIDCVQDRPCVQGLDIMSWIVGASIASITSEVATAKISEYVKKLNKWLWTSHEPWHPVRKCYRCQLKRECPIACSGGVEHWFCLECAPLSSPKCAYCQCPTKGKVTPAGKGVIAYLGQFLARLTASTYEALSTLAATWGCPALKVYTSTMRLSTFLALLGPGYNGAAGAFLGAHVLFTFLPSRGEPEFNDVTQAGRAYKPTLGIRKEVAPSQPAITMSADEFDSQEDEINVGASTSAICQGESPVVQDLIEVPDKLPIYSIVVTEEQICALNKKVKGTGKPCLHGHLMDLVEFARYDQDAFVIVDGSGANTRVSLEPCDDPTCPFLEVDPVKMFLRQWVDHHHNSIRRHLAFYYNGQSTKELLYSSVPEILIPAWARNPIETPKLSKWRWWEYLKSFTAKFKRLFLYTTIGAGVLGGMVALWKMWPKSIDDVQTQSPDYALPHLRKVGRKIQITRTKNPKVQSEDMLNQTIDKLVRNQVLIRVLNDEGTARHMLAQGVYGHVAILPKHYIRHIRALAGAGCKVTIEPVKYHVDGANPLRNVYTFDPKDFKEHPDTDLAYFVVPKSFPMFKDIRTLFWTDEDTNRPLAAEASIVAGPTSLRHYVKVASVELKGHKSLLSVVDEDGGTVTNRDVLVYDYSEKGACGSFVVSGVSTRPLMAMHTAGMGSGEGYATIVTQQLLDSFLPKEVVVQSEDIELAPLSDRSFVIDDVEVALDYLGEVPPRDRPHIPSSTKIRRSAVHKVAGLEPETEPAILHADDPRYREAGISHTPLYHGVAKHGLRTIDFPSSLVRRAGDGLYEGWFASMRPVLVAPKRLTMEQAVLGFKDVPYYDPMRLTTSAGYPWTQKGRGTSKNCWIEVARDENDYPVDCVIHPELRAEILRKEKLRKQGIVPATIFVDTLKDERKTPEKTRRPGGTRVFCSSPVDFTVSMRQNLLHFCAAMMKARLKVMSAVGINAKGTEWTELFNYLNTVGRGKVFSMDYANFGPGFNAVVAAEAARLIKRWTLENVQDVDEAELDALLMECIQSLHIAGGTVYQQFCGSPSGAAITTIINSIVNELYVLIAWLLILEINQIKVPDVWAEFKRNVAVAVYGDDLIAGVSPEYGDKFNAVSISSCLAHYKIVATDAMKTGSMEPLTNIWKAEFLKRGFRPHPTRDEYVLAPLRWVSVNDATQWVWSGPNIKTATRVNCEAALMEAHGHGPARFEEFKRQVNQALRQRRIDPITMEWDNLDQLWFDTGLPEPGPVWT